MNNPRKAIPRSTSNAGWVVNNTDRAKINLTSRGFTSLEAQINPQLLAELQAEATDRRKYATQAKSTDGCQYQSHLVGLGEVGTAFLTGQGVSELLTDFFGRSVTLQKEASCYTYYRPGDFLDVHLDHADHCKITLILYLDVVYPKKRAVKTGLELHVFGKSLSDGDRSLVIIPSRVGSVLIGLGFEYWHKRPQLQKGESVTALTTCFA